MSMKTFTINFDDGDEMMTIYKVMFGVDLMTIDNTVGFCFYLILFLRLDVNDRVDPDGGPVEHIGNCV